MIKNIRNITLGWLLLAITALAQPPPAPAVPFTSIMGKLISQGFNMIEMIREQLETPLMGYLDSFAFWIAVIVMMGSFLNLLKNDDGATKNLFWWCTRLLVCFALFGLGPRIITMLHGAGVSATQIPVIADFITQSEANFNDSYSQYVNGMMVVKPINTRDPDEVIGILYDKNVQAEGRNITTLFNGSAWNLTNIFALLSLFRGIQEFAYVFLMILGEFLTIAFRLFAPFAIAVAIDRNLAGKITYPFLQSVIAFTLVMPIVVMIIGIFVPSLEV